MEAKLDSLERMVASWTQNQEENSARFAQQDARLAKLEQMVERLANLLGESSHEGNRREVPHENRERVKSKGEAPGVENAGDKWRKLDIPVFEGEDAYGWVNKLDRYFRLKGVTEEEKMQAVMVALEGEALSWFHWWEACNPRPAWGGFKSALIQRFQPATMRSPFESLLSLKQSHSINEFVSQFERHAGALKGLDEEHLMDVFLNGLRKEVSAELKL